MNDLFFFGDLASQPTNVPALILAVLLSFIGGHIIAWVYMKTHSGLSYSRSFVNSLILIPMIVSLVMMVLSNNLVTAFGMMAVFAILRFRNILRDTLDTAYILAVLVIGMACGTYKFATGIFGILLIAVAMVYLHVTGFGVRHRYDIIVNLHWGRALAELAELKNLLHRYSRRTVCASQRSSEGPQGTDLSYRLLLRDPGRIEELLSEIRLLSGVSRVSSLQAQDESEL